MCCSRLLLWVVSVMIGGLRFVCCGLVRVLVSGRLLL